MREPESVTRSAAPPDPADDLLWRHLKSLPAFRALLRAVEARFYRHLEIADPVLDLGCGDGHFAGMAFTHPLAVGVDPWWGPLNKAVRARVYQLNTQALGDALPFADGVFASVISNSVLEHIPDIQPVLNEASRVLQPGGQLIITMPSHLFTENLGGAALLRPLGLAGAYRRFFNRISRHAHTDSPEIWAGRLTRAGFTVDRWQYYFSKDALRALEIGHVQGLPSAILHFLTGHWIVAPWRDNLRLTERWLRPYYDEQPPKKGAYLLIVARKSGALIPPRQEIDVRLPAPRPLPNEEPASDPTAVVSPGQNHERTTLTQPDNEEQEEVTFRLSQETDRETVDSRSAPLLSRGLLAGILLFAGLFAALTAQSILSQRLPSVTPAIIWYVIALGAFATAVAVLRRTARRQGIDYRQSDTPFPKRLLLYPLAIALAVMAQNQSGNTLVGGNAFVALLLWVASTALAFYTLSHPAETPGPPDKDVPASAVPPVEPTQSRLAQLPHAVPLLLVSLFLIALVPRLIQLAAHPYIINGIEASLGLDTLAVLQGHIRNPFATAWLTNPSLPLFPAALPMALLGRTVVALRILSVIVGALTVPTLFLVTRRLWGNWFALACSLFLAGYHLHVHYSRLGMTNIWDPLIALLIFGALTNALHTPSRRNWLVAGVTTGISAYFYTISHLIPFFLLFFLLYLLFLRRDLLAAQGGNMLAAAAMALVVALPQIVYYQKNSGLFIERANILGIFHSNWLVQQAGAGQSAAGVLMMHLRRAFLAFNGSLDASTSYNPGIPLLRSWPAIFFTLGAALALWRVRHARFAIPLIWLFVTLIFAGALLVDAPGSHRMLIAAPFVAILLTTGLFWFARRVRDAAIAYVGHDEGMNLAPSVPLHVTAALLVIIFFVAGDLFFYFGQYRQDHRFGDRNSEIAHEVGRYLHSLDGDWRAYFHGPPAMYVSFPTILYFAESYQPGINLIDVPEDATQPPVAQPGENLVFIYLPERSGEVNQTAQRYPDGEFITFDGMLQNPLFYSYEVRP